MTRTQAGVAVGMAAALGVTLAVLFYGAGLIPLALPSGEPPLSARLVVAAAAWLSPLAALTASVGFIANRRFFSPADIDGAGLTDESPAIRIPRAILANTHEQATLALITYAGLAIALPASQLALPLALSIAFAAGRIAFALGYARGAGARAFGFGLTFYPTVGGAIVLALRLANLAGGTA
jgi:hypothetical protein